MAKKNPSPAKLRELVMQALYQKEISGSSNTDLIKQFKQTNRNFNLKGFENCLREIKKDILEINSIIEKHTNIEIEGWPEPTAGINNYDDFPQKAKISSKK